MAAPHHARPEVRGGGGDSGGVPPIVVGEVYGWGPVRYVHDFDLGTRVDLLFSFLVWTAVLDSLLTSQSNRLPLSVRPLIL